MFPLRLLAMLRLTGLLLTGLTPLVFTEALSAQSWSPPAEEAKILSSHDSNLQPAYYWIPGDVSEPVPLLVGLHSWSADYQQTDPGVEYLNECRNRGWAFIHPNFRGPNTNPDACGSEAALQDIRDAVLWMKRKTAIDSARVYAVGASGGGHAALMAASRWPDIWAAVSAWVPPTDLSAWYRHTRSKDLKYWKHLTSVCGGAPGESTSVDLEYKQRSPVHRLDRAKGIPIEIAAGIRDGHGGSVPVSHTLWAFNALVRANGYNHALIPEETIDEIVRNMKIPADLARGAPADPTYTKPVLFRRSAGPVRVTLFEGGHEILVPAAIAWLEQHARTDR